MTILFTPSTDEDSIRKALEERSQRISPAPDYQFHLDQTEELLDQVEKIVKSSFQPPRRLCRFPFNWCPCLGRFFMRAKEFFLREQKEVNHLLLSALRECRVSIEKKSTGPRRAPRKHQPEA